MVDGHTLAWVVENDPYYKYNFANPDLLSLGYDTGMLDSFGMDNNWVEHETLFLPSDENDAWEYNDTPWFSATILNSADRLDASEYTDIVEAQGALKHAKLVYALHLPSQVTFYDGAMLTDDKELADSNNAYKWIGDYDEDEADYAFYVERVFRDRHATTADLAKGEYVVDAEGHQVFEVNADGTPQVDADGNKVPKTTADVDAGEGVMKTERLTPKQLLDRGWTVKITYQSDYGDNTFAESGSTAVRGGKNNAHYGKADADDPSDTVEYRGLVSDTLSGATEANQGVGSYASVKPNEHDREVVVFELAAPDDADDDEFNDYDSLLEGFYGGVHADGYLGYGDSLTLKVKTRLDNLGDVDSAMDEGLYEDGKLVSYKKQMETISSWEGDDSQVYATAHETKLNWVADKDGWDHRPADGGNVLHKPKADDEEAKTLIGTSFHGQSVNRFYRAGEQAADHLRNNINYDRDSDYDDLYVTDTSGWFRIRKPSVSVRADTAQLRSLLYNSDMNVYTGQDVQLKGDNSFYLTQAINTGGAVNSFIVDWQVPFWATAGAMQGGNAMTVNNAHFESKDYALGRFQSLFESVSTGIWEVPGALYTTNGKPDGTAVPSTSPQAQPANEAAETESQLRLFMFARVATMDRSQDGNVFEEQNGAVYNEYENFALPGSDADRDYWYGEDDTDDFGSSDYNTADSQTWVPIGNRSGYAIADKENVTIDDSFLEQYANCQVRQIRWVIKAVPVTKDGEGNDVANVRDDTLATKVAVPHGFRLDVDAMLGDADDSLEDSAGNVVDPTGKQEADDFDPLRLNAGWAYRLNNLGLLDTLDAAGNYYPDTTVGIHEGITNGAPLIRFSSSVMSKLVVGLGGRDPVDEDTGRPADSSEVHANHFVSAVPRYDDTKHVETERSRAGFIRTPESPVLALTITQGYFTGDRKLYQWRSGNNTIDKRTSRMMRYKIVLSNLSADQMAALGFEGYEPDNCGDPQISQILPFVEGYAEAELAGRPLTYVSYEDLQKDAASARPQFAYFDWDYTSQASGSLNATNINDKTPIWTYYLADMTDFLDVEKVVTSQSSSTPRLNDTSVGGDFLMRDKAGSLDPNTGEPVMPERKFMSWQFTGQRTTFEENGETFTETDRGVLRPGQGLVVELLMPIDSSNNDLLSEDLLMTSAYGYKPGNFMPFTPSASSNDGSTRGLVSDTRDVNMDGQRSQSMIMMQLKALEFEAQGTLNITKTVTSAIEALTDLAAVPEGSSYTYHANILNNDGDEKKAQNFKDIVFYDILPYAGDNKILASNGGDASSRGSKWNGVVTDLDSIQVKRFSASTAYGLPADGQVLEDGNQIEIWVGPYTEDENGVLQAGVPDDLMWLYDKTEKYTYGPKFPTPEEQMKPGFDLNELLPDGTPKWDMTDFKKREDTVYETIEAMRLGESGIVDGQYQEIMCMGVHSFVVVEFHM